MLRQLEAVKGEPVLLRIDGHGAQAELVGGAEDAYCDFARLAASSLPIGLVFFISEAISACRAKFYIVSWRRGDSVAVFSI